MRLYKKEIIKIIDKYIKNKEIKMENYFTYENIINHYNVMMSYNDSKKFTHKDNEDIITNFIHGKIYDKDFNNYYSIRFKGKINKKNHKNKKMIKIDRLKLLNQLYKTKWNEFKAKSNLLYDKINMVFDEIRKEKIYPPYNLNNLLENKYVNMNNELDYLEILENKYYQKYDKIEKKIFIIKNNQLINSYSDKKYKIKFIDNKEVLFVNDYEKHKHKNIHVYKLIKSNKLYKPYEKCVYGNKNGRILEVSYDDFGYKLEEVHKKNKIIKWREIYRRWKNESVSYIKFDSNRESLYFKNSKLRVELRYDYNRKGCIITYGYFNCIYEITPEAQELINKLLDRLDKDKSINFRELYSRFV